MASPMRRRQNATPCTLKDEGLAPSRSIGSGAFSAFLQALQVGLLIFCVYRLQQPRQPAPLPLTTSDRAVASKVNINAYIPPIHNRCQMEIVGGRPKDNYGAWPLCGNHVPGNSTIYSFGIGGDVSFDIEMIKRGHTIYAFDPTVKPEAAQAMFKSQGDKDLLSHFNFMQVGLGQSNGVVQFLKPKNKDSWSMTAVLDNTQKSNYQNEGFMGPVLTLPTIMTVLGHDHIDLLKVDVEGVEFDICETPAFQETLDKVGQVIYEFHEGLLIDGAGREDKCTRILEGKGFKLVKWTNTGEHVFARVAPKAKITVARRKTKRL